MLHASFPDRAAAGRALASQVARASRPPTVVLGIPNGGLVVAAPIAKALGAPLCAVWVRKLASPQEPDVTIGAVDLDGDVTLGVETVRAEGLSDDRVAEIAYHAHKLLLADWERAPGLDATSLLPGASAVIVDDALCTGLSLWAAMRWARRQGAGGVVLAVPVVDQRIWAHLSAHADAAVTLEQRADGPITRSEVYRDFRRVPVEEITRLLGGTGGERAPRTST